MAVPSTTRLSTDVPLPPRPRPSTSSLVALVVLPALLAAAACSAPSSSSAGSAASSTTSAASTGAPGSPVPAPPSPTTPSPASVSVRVDGRSVIPSPRDVPVPRGSAVRLVVTTDVDNVLHVHGLEVERRLPAGTPVSLELTFPEPGVYQAETHDPELLLLRFVVR